MPEHMSQAEICTMDRMQKHGRSAAAILACLQAARTKNGTDGPSDSAVHSFLAGETYKRGSKELRGAKARLPPRLVAVANAQRRKLIRAAKNDHVVTWQDIRAATNKAFRLD